MSLTTKKTNHCLVSLAILGSLLLMIFSIVLIPWWHKIGFYDDRIETLAYQISRFESIQARKPGLEKQLQVIQSRLKDNNYFLTADTPALAAADLQQRVKLAVEANGGQLISTQNMTNAKDDKLIEVIIRVRMSGGGNVLAGILHNLESGSPLLMVDNLTVRSNKRYKGRGRNRVVEFHQDTHFDLIGFLRGAGS